MPTAKPKAATAKAASIRRKPAGNREFVWAWELGMPTIIEFINCVVVCIAIANTLKQLNPQSVAGV